MNRKQQNTHIQSNFIYNINLKLMVKKMLCCSSSIVTVDQERDKIKKPYTFAAV